MAAMSIVFCVSWDCVKTKNSNERVGVWHYNATTSRFKMVARRNFNDQNKSLSMNYIYRIIKF